MMSAVIWHIAGHFLNGMNAGPDPFVGCSWIFTTFWYMLCR